MAAILFFVSSVSMINAKEKHAESVKLEVKEFGKKLELTYRSAEADFVKIKILNNKGRVVFSERINRDKFIRPYNISNLKDGTYSVEVSDGEKTYTQSFEKRSSFYPADFQFVDIRKAKSDEDKIIVTALSGKKDVFFVKIYNDEGVLVHGSYQNVAYSSGKVYQIKNADKEKYTIEVSNGNEELLKKVVL